MFACCLPADDGESTKCHLEGIIVRDLSAVVSNYRSTMTLDEYLKKQNVRGIANVDTRAITRRLRWAAAAWKCSRCCLCGNDGCFCRYRGSHSAST